MVKFADDTYLVVPADNVTSSADEIAHVECWAMARNLSLNRTKSAEIVFVSTWSKRFVKLPPSHVPSFERVDSIKAFGVTVRCLFSSTQHVDNVLAACAQTLFALRTLKHHGLPTFKLHTPSSKLQW